MANASQELAETYRGFSDDEIASLHAQIDTLTEEARAALVAEFQRRGLNGALLNKLHAVELRREAQFDRRETFRRKKLAWGSFGFNDLKGWMVVILVVLVYVLVRSLIARSHR